MPIWQIAAGSVGRDYSDCFIKYGIAFVGGDTQIAAMDQVQLGDIIILKRGLTEILAAGRVVQRGGIFKGNGDKDWLKDFDGWDLPAYCYVDWHIPQQPISTTGLSRATIQQTHQAAHATIAANIMLGPITPCQPEPPLTVSVTDAMLLSFLVNQGLRPSASDELTDTLRKIRLLAEYYYHNSWSIVKEHETRTFLVIPFLLALGWSEQQMKIEHACQGGRIDIACFARRYSGNNDRCVLIIETKDFSSGLDYAPQQAQLYAAHFPDCQVMLVTNGFCYKTFVKDAQGVFNPILSAYLNLMDPRARYPLDPTNVDGAFGVLHWLLPSNLT